MKSKIIIGSRGSKLALIYAQNAKDKMLQNTGLNDKDVVIKEITRTRAGPKLLDFTVRLGGMSLFPAPTNGPQHPLKILCCFVCFRHHLKHRKATQSHPKALQMTSKSDPENRQNTHSLKKRKPLKTTVFTMF